MNNHEEHSLSLSFQIRRAIKAENELQVAQAQVKLLTDQWNALPIKELVVNADYREMWRRQLKMNQQLIASLSAEKQAQPVQVNATLVEALEEARNGLAWYQAMYPGATDGSDDEAMERIDAAIAGASNA